MLLKSHVPAKAYCIYLPDVLFLTKLLDPNPLAHAPCQMFLKMAMLKQNMPLYT